MKKVDFKTTVLFLGLLLLSISLFISSCKKEEEPIQIASKNQISTKNDILLKQMKSGNIIYSPANFIENKVVKTWIANNNDKLEQISNKNGIDFNYNNIRSVRNIETGGYALIINQKDVSPNNKNNLAIALYLKKGKIVASQIVKTSTLEKNIKSINYYDIDGKQQYEILIDTKDKTVEYLASGSDAGQETIDCITDAYSNHGWVSVWAWVQTAFIPETAVAIAAACAAEALTSDK